MLLTEEEAKKAVEDNIGSLELLCKRAIYTADENLMLAIGFPARTSSLLCEMVRKGAKDLGIRDLEEYFYDGKSPVINRMIRKNHKLYFATRSNLPPAKLLGYLKKSRKDMCEILYEISTADTYQTKKSRRSKELANAVARVREQVRKRVNTIMTSMHGAKR